VTKRLLAAVPLLFGVILINFTLIHLAPGDPILALVGEYAPSEDQIAALRQRMGLDRPLHIQFLSYVAAILQGDFGYSYVRQAPVLTLILERVPATALLMLSSLVVFTVIGVALAVAASRRPYSVVDASGSMVALIGYSLPVFWLGQLALLAFARQLGWFPTQGMIDGRAGYEGLAYGLDALHHLALPMLVLGTRYLAINYRFARASMLEALSQDYVTAARSRGLRERTVLGNALRNAILPVVTVFGVNFGDILAGSVMTEIVFGWPGLGRLLYDAMFARDYPLLMGMFVFISIGVIAANILVDIVYVWIDPRVRHD